MRGNHLYHRDVYDLVRLWTCDGYESIADNSIDGNPSRRGTLPDLDENDPLLRPICPRPLVEIARMCNPF